MLRLLTMTFCGVLVGCAATPEFDYGEKAYEQHIAVVTQGMPPKVAASMTSACGAVRNAEEPASVNADAPSVPADPAAARVPPMQVFDNLYFVGDRDISVWALTTSDGIILFDSHHAALVEDRVIGGLRQLGLDPTQIKYVVVTHGHDDHYGGAKLLQERYGARVLMGAADWQTHVAPDSSGASEPLPRRDIAVTGRKTLTLGGTTVTLLPTPGHTPGTLSALIPVTDHGEPHVAALVGGGLPFGSLPAMKEFATSFTAFGAAAAFAKADVLISNHPKNDDSLAEMRRLAQRSSDAPNPFVMGVEPTRQRITQAQQCARAWIARNGP